LPWQVLFLLPIASILPTYPRSESRYRLQLLSDEDNYRLVTPTEHRGERVVTRTKYHLVGSRDEIERRPTKPSLIASLSLQTWLPQRMPAPVANGRSAALARQRDHVESDQRNPYIWPRDSTGLGRREPIVLVSSHCVECPPNIFRTPLILRFMKFLHFIHDLEC
ncbi:hypothetical protein ALC60_08337, partial [Trachymyrmex zeteki]